MLRNEIEAALNHFERADSSSIERLFTKKIELDQFEKLLYHDRFKYFERFVKKMLKVGLENPLKLINDNIFHKEQCHTNLDCVQLLLKYCKDKHSDITANLKRLLTDPYKIQADEMYRSLANDDLEVFKKIQPKIWEEKAVGYYVTDDCDSSLLHIAALNGAEEIVEYMLKIGWSELVGTVNCMEVTAVAYALECHNFHIIKLLLSYADEYKDKDLIYRYSDCFDFKSSIKNNVSINISKAQKRRKQSNNKLSKHRNGKKKLRNQ